MESSRKDDPAPEAPNHNDSCQNQVVATGFDNATAGSLGGLLAMLIIWPLEKIKTLQQAPGRRRSGLAVLQELRENGSFYRELFRGCGPMLQTVAISNFIFFYISVLTKRVFGSGTSLKMLAGNALAGALNMTLTEPLWKVSTQLQLGQLPGDLPQGLLSLYRRELQEKKSPKAALLALWSGLPVSLWLVTNPMIQFWVYDSGKLSWCSLAGRDFNGSEAFFLGAFSKAVATILTYPLQIAQTRLRVTERRMIDCLLEVVNEEGWEGLFRGLPSKLLGTCMTAAFMFFFYEKILNAIMGLRRGRAIAY
jgi:adenine nucleotide transporter 17